MKPNFGGYATKYGVLCSDGRTIVANAFQHEDKKRLPLIWRHDKDRTPQNILGHVILEHRDGDGVYARAYFNQTSNALHSKDMIEHGDIDQLSIKAVGLEQDGLNVVKGNLVEVSLVPVGANREAKIDAVYIEHDGLTYENQNEGYIFSNVQLELMHEDAEDDEDEDEEETDEEDDEDEDEDEDDLDHESTPQQVYDSLNDEQKLLVSLLIAQAAEQDVATHEHQGANMTNTRNVFDQTEDPKPGNVLTHEQQESIFESAKRLGSLKKAVLEHAEQYGITNIDELFPDAKNVTQTPEWVKRDDGWVSAVLGGVNSRPFSRIRSMSADITHEEARAKGYIKGTLKKEEYYAVAKRDTTPTTVYKKQKLDRDDMIDVTDFNVVAWMKGEMRGMLSEELARAYLFGDGREAEDPDKIDENKIRPIATDDDFYTTKVMIPANLASKSLAQKILRSRKYIKGGTGRPTLYTTDSLIVDLLLMENQLGERYYKDEASLASGLGVASLVDCDVLEEGYTDDQGNVLLGVMVNIADYSVGMDRGGEIGMFEDFDLDYNQHKYLIETRRSAALTKHHSAISFWSTSAVRIMPEEPDLTSENTIGVPDQIGVAYYHRVVGQDDVDISGEEITLTAGNTPYTIVAVAEDGYRFPLNTQSSWTFNWVDPA